MVTGHAEIKCPFCDQMGVKAHHRPSYVGHKTSSISAGSKTKCYRLPESYEVLGGCLPRGKSKEEIERAFETGVVRKQTHKERLKGLRKAGLPTKVVSTRRE